MLALTLCEGDYLLIGDNIRVHFDHKIGKDTLAISIEAPKDLTILRDKLYEAKMSAKAAKGDTAALAFISNLEKRQPSKGIRPLVKHPDPTNTTKEAAKHALTDT